MSDIHQLIGYFETSEQVIPTYDPPRTGPCIVCYRPMADGTRRTISLLEQLPNAPSRRSLFYRGHRECLDRLSAGERDDIDESVMAAWRDRLPKAAP